MALGDAVGSAGTGTQLPQHEYASLMLTSALKKITGDGLHLWNVATSKRIAIFAKYAGDALLRAVDEASFGANRGSVDQTPAGYLKLLLDHPSFGVPSPTSCLPSVVRAGLANALLPGMGSRLGGRKMAEYSEVPPRLATLCVGLPKASACPHIILPHSVGAMLRRRWRWSRRRFSSPSSLRTPESAARSTQKSTSSEPRL